MNQSQMQLQDYSHFWSVWEVESTDRNMCRYHLYYPLPNGTFCRKLCNIKILQIWAVGNSHAWNLCQIWGRGGSWPYNGGFGLEIGPLLRTFMQFSWLIQDYGELYWQKLSRPRNTAWATGWNCSRCQKQLTLEGICYLQKLDLSHPGKDIQKEFTNPHTNNYRKKLVGYAPRLWRL